MTSFTDVCNEHCKRGRALFDHAPATLPDTTLEVPQTTDPHSATSGVLIADGIDYFHLRTCDLAGNCTSTVHAGPYEMDTTAPSNPTAPASTTHQLNCGVVPAKSSPNRLAMDRGSFGTVLQNRV